MDIKRNLMMLVVFFGIFSCIPLLEAQEQITITTYYPSPMGAYRQLRAERMIVATTTNIPTSQFTTGADPMVDGELRWGGANSIGRLTADNGSSIKVGGSGTPYIDLSNDMTSDYDARIMLYNNDTLRFYVGSQVQIRNRGDTQWRDLEVGDLYLCD